MKEKGKKLILPSILSDNMVFQQNRPIKIWGITEPLSKIQVKIVRKLDRSTVRAGECFADDEGSFQVQMIEMKGSFEQYDVIVTGIDTVIIEDVMFGEVWLAAGQSNMQLNLQYIVDGHIFMKQANNSNIRIFYQDHIPEKDSRVDGDFSYTPCFDVYNGYWKKADFGENIACCSGIGYVFALELYKMLKAKGKETPIAIINSATGSSSIHSWIDRKMIESTPKVKDFLIKNNVLKPENEWNDAKEWNFNQVSALYNHKIAPIINLNMRGVLWYQGENDVGEEENQNYYKEALRALIENWGEDKVYLLTQLAPFEYQFSKQALPQMRESLVKVHRIFPHFTSVMPIHDVDLLWDYGDFGYKHPIHPLTKAPIGKRMALAAMGLAYGYDKNYNLSPILKDIKIEQNKATIIFENVGSGLKIKEGDSELKGFTICGDNRVFKEAKARIVDKDKVEVLNEEICSPIDVRYGFTPINNNINLMNSNEIPAIPFETDLRFETTN